MLTTRPSIARVAAAATPHPRRYQYAAGGTCRPDLLNCKTNEGNRLVARAMGVRRRRPPLQPGLALAPRSPAAHSTAKPASPMASTQRANTGALANPRDPLLQSGRQMLDAAFERKVVALAHDHVHMPLIVVDERLPQRRKVSDQ